MNKTKIKHLKKCVNCSSKNIEYNKNSDIVFCKDCNFTVGNMNNLTNLKILTKELNKENSQKFYNKEIEALQKKNTAINKLSKERI